MQQLHMSYPATPGYKRDSVTSKAAARSVVSTAHSMRMKILTAIKLNALHGATCDELQISLGMLAQTASARFRELALQGLITDSGQTRATRTGRAAVVWLAVRDEPKQTGVNRK